MTAPRTEQSPAPPFTNRRQKLTLREMLDDLIVYTREVTRTARTMTDADIEYAHRRLEWMADEVWREAIEAGRKSG